MTKYKDYEISFSYDLDMVTCDELNLSAASPVELKKAIDAHIRKMTEAIKTPVIFLDGYRERKLIHGIAGAVDKGYGGSIYRWVSWSEGKGKDWGKKSQDMLYPDTPETVKMFEQYFELVRLVEAAEVKAADFLAKIPSIADQKDEA